MKSLKSRKLEEDVRFEWFTVYIELKRYNLLVEDGSSSDRYTLSHHAVLFVTLNCYYWCL